MQINPYYKKQIKSIKLPTKQKHSRSKSAKRSFFQMLKPLQKTNFTNINKTNLTNNLINKSKSPSEISNLETIVYKLSDFGLCKNINESHPLQFGCSTYLAPEICQMGPDSAHVSPNLTCRLIILSWTFML